jgi:hypothetical protein
MTEPIIAKITDGECGIVELLQEAQLLINQRDAYKRALQNAIEDSGKGFTTNELLGEIKGYYDYACKELESEKINNGKVA